MTRLLKMYDCHQHGMQRGTYCPYCVVHAYIPLLNNSTQTIISESEDLKERIRMLNDIALSALALKLNIEHGFPPMLDALNRDLNAFQKRFGGIDGNTKA